MIQNSLKHWPIDRLKSTCEQIILRFDFLSGDIISNLKLQKILYYLQGWSLACEGKPLFKGGLQAWEHGPVAPDAYHNYKRFGCEAILLTSPPPLRKDPLLETVVQFYGGMSAKKLEELTHEESPWKSVYKEGVWNIPISEDSLKEFFLHEAPESVLHAYFLQEYMDAKYQTCPVTESSLSSLGIELTEEKIKKAEQELGLS